MISTNYIKIAMPEEALHAIEWNATLPPFHALRLIRLTDPTKEHRVELEMERLDHHPTNWSQIGAAAEGAIWEYGYTDYMHIDHEAYRDYCLAIALYCKIEVEATDALCDLIDTYCQPCYLTPVRNVHGDLTLSNVMYDENGRLVFIDPGHHRGLPCRELDYAKLLQSQDGWDEVRYGREVKQYPRLYASKSTYVLLATHYLRLLRHPHPEPAKQFARRRFYELLELLA